MGGTIDVAPANTTDTTTLNMLPIVNNGTLKVSKGTLATSVGGTGTGTYNLLTGTTLDLNGGLFDISGATVTGAGNFNLNGGGQLKGSPAAANLVLNGGQLAGGGTITFPAGSTVTLTGSGVEVTGTPTWSTTPR